MSFRAEFFENNYRDHMKQLRDLTNNIIKYNIHWNVGVIKNAINDHFTESVINFQFNAWRPFKFALK